MTDDVEYGQKVVRLEAAALTALVDLIGETFRHAVELVISCDGHVVTTGMGKSGVIAQKISATLASTGTPSFFLHPAEAIHGDLGRVSRDDLVIALSNSGANEELLRVLPGMKRIGARLIAITRDPDSPLGQHADCVLPVGEAPEACPVGLAPTTSTTAQLALGDALAMTVAKRRKFSREEYALYHPGGALGRALMTVGEVMAGKDRVLPARTGVTTREALEESGGRGRRVGALPIVDDSGKLKGLLTDGDVRRHVLTNPGFLDRPIEEAMTMDPLVARPEQLAADAWHDMKERQFDELPVVDADRAYLGILDVQDLLQAGFSA